VHDIVSTSTRSSALVITVILAGCALRAPSTVPATFTNPIVRSQAAGDPWVIRHGDAYYFTATLKPDEGLWVWKSGTLTGLDSGVKVKVWDAPASGPLSRQIWAPELHWLGGRWYLYFTASDGVDANHRHYVLVSKSDDPQGAYEAPVRVDPAFESYAIDGSVLAMPNGRLYFMYCAGGVFIAPMSDPTHVSGPGVQIIRGSEEWEHEWRFADGEWTKGAGYWVEAPEALIHEGRVFIVYSAGHTATPHYYLGLLSLIGSDPMDPAAWTKRRSPLFAPYEGADGKVFTPGHNSFTRSPDDREDWIIYHARDIPFENGSPAGFRTVRAQRFTWASDGSPQLGHPIPSGIPLQKPSGESQSSNRR
jgi:GH43 family beta-xylosidase